MNSMLNDRETKEAVDHWQRSAEEDFKTAQALFETKRYHHCLFFCHLFLEKILKSLVVEKTSSHALPTHNLLKLAKDADITLDPRQSKDLAIINEFNIRARYDDFKEEFYKKATSSYTREWFTKSKELYLWLKAKSSRK